MIGETVHVVRRSQSGVNSRNTPVYTSKTEAVEDVLVAPGPRTDITEPGRLDGVEVAFTLHFPKTYTRDLTGTSVRVRGGAPMPVIGSPASYTLENTPGRWATPVEVRRADG